MHNNAADWNETAVRQAMDECDNVPYLMIGSLGLGAVALAFTNYFVAGALTLGGVALSQRKQNHAIARAEFAIKHNGSAVAARGNELKEYTESFGQNAAAEQLLHAAQKGIPLNRDGWNLLEDHYGDRLDDLVEQKEAAKGHRWFEPELVPIKDENAKPETLDDLADAFGDAPPVQPPNALEFLRSLSQSPLQPVIIAGLPGSGKGVMAAIALSLGVRDNGLRYWLFNPKPKLEEAGYWSRAEKHYLKDRLTNDDELFSDLMATLELFGSEGSRRNNQPGEYEPFILLIEEVNALTGLLTPKERQIFKSKITALASLLRGCNMAIWLSGQSVTLEDLGFSGKSNRAMFTAISAIGSDRTGCKNICDALAIPFDEATLPAGRAWLTGTAVYPALQAPNNIPQYATWGDVPNVIDLRPGATAAELPQDIVSFLASDIEEVLGLPALTPKKIEEIANAYGLQMPEIPRSAKQQLEDVYKLNVTEPTAIQEVIPTQKIDFDLDDVLPELRPIVEYSIKQNGLIKAIDVKRNVKEFKSVSTEDIRNHFIGLANQGCGASQGDGDFLKYSAFGGCDEV